jgi:hypothetical protein
MRAAHERPSSNWLAHYEALFGNRATRAKQAHGKLDRSSLPTPRSYLERRNLLSAGQSRHRSGWISIRCPVHKGGDEQHPSMRVSLADGHFKCHACGASGGDIIALHRLATGMGFLNAVADLGGRFHD